VADDLLVELCEPDRIVAFTAYGAASPVGYRYGGKSQVASEQDAEGILALKPDLFLTNNIGPSANLSPLRSSGVEVFDLGEMRGLSTFLANARTIATLIGHPERGERFAASFARRFDHVAAGSDARLRKRGLYLSGYGGQLFGGTTGTSYHDVLVHAGLVDAAAGTFTNWPQYSAEQILTLDPDVLVTKPGMKDLLCRGSGLDGLKACANGAIIEVPAEIIDDPGALMLDAAELIHARMVAPRALAGAGP
jgi:iron complex transport system substrate-binding protein